MFKNPKKFCFVCCKTFPFNGGIQVKHPKLGVKTIHKSCAKKLLKENSEWQLYNP